MESCSELALLEAVQCKYPFVPGSPGPETLESCTGIMRTAAENVLSKDADVEDLFMYGTTGGDKSCLEELSKYLSTEYGEQVNSKELMLTAGASHGLHMVLTLLFGRDNPVFTEDPSYFYGFKMIRTDLQRNLVPVPFDEEGIVPEELERLVLSHKQTGATVSEDRPFWAAVYMMPVFHNPCGISYSADRCEKLIEVARKHNILLIAEDIYNMIYFEDRPHAPRRLLSFDKATAADSARGHVLSIGSFSKILAPSLRMGWVEGPTSVMSLLNQSNYANSGGSFNHFVSKLATSVLQSGVLLGHVSWLRQVYKKRMAILAQILTDNLPYGCSFRQPQGGFFLWLQLRKDTDASEFLNFATKKFGVNFLPGVHCSPSDAFVHCARLSVSVAGESLVAEGGQVLCQAYRAFLGRD
ncbi:uncharacterized HTH-type transcriptional regulator YdfD [Aplysia californica]|uniref:Uncharacterized HTH-type transcriptional regulator YdfD n=1 Tax=Aplysia californica TaxID=6500 RepID=A0ABM1AEV0_APLCA|nr:uncharacterized HTH-type transcriptional regulator YdfD [Aplysia californica]